MCESVTALRGSHNQCWDTGAHLDGSANWGGGGVPLELAELAKPQDAGAQRESATERVGFTYRTADYYSLPAKMGMRRCGSLRWRDQSDVWCSCP